MTTKPTKTAIIFLTSALLAASALQNNPRNACSLGCESCMYNPITKLYECSQCLRSYFINKFQCSSTPAPTSDNCAIYILDGRCGYCNDGYLIQTLFHKINGKGWICRRAYDPKYVAGTFKLNQQDNHGPQEQRCTTCEGGYPSKDLSHCVAWSSGEAPALCTQGSRFLKNGPVNCSRCQPGYTFDLFGGNCVKTVLPGCLLSQGTFRCNACDLSKNYYIYRPGKCAKLPSLESSEKTLF